MILDLMILDFRFQPHKLSLLLISQSKIIKSKITRFFYCLRGTQVETSAIVPEKLDRMFFCLRQMLVDDREYSLMNDKL